MEIIGRFTLVKNKYANTNRCINFKTKEREDELIAQFPHKTFDSNFFTQDGDSILLPLSYEETITYNYCYFNNRINNTEQKRYFCYITNYQYVEPNITRISIAVDTLQTFFFDIDKLRGNLNRCHAPRRINLGTSEAPKYIINPDLYFMEDDVNENYVAKASKEGDNLPPYLVLTFAIPYADTDKVVQGCVNKLGHYAEPIPEGSTWFGSAVVGISFPDRYGTGSNVKSIGGTQIYSIVLSARNDFVGATYLPTISFNEFKNRYSVLMDKLIDCFYIDSPRNAFLKNKCMWSGAQTILDEIFDEDDVSFVIPFDSRLYFFNDVKETFVRKRIETSSNDDVNPSKWVNRDADDLNVRLVEQEKKLDLYPYSFVKITHMNNDFIWKYQEQYRFLVSPLGLENYIYSFVSWVDITSPNPTMMSSMLSDYENLVNINDTTDLLYLFNADTPDSEIRDYFTQYDAGLPLPSLSIYQEKYTQYLNYQKALVDANNAIGVASSVANMFSGGYSINEKSGGGSVSTVSPKYTKTTRYNKAGESWVSSIKGTTGVKRTTTKLPSSSESWNFGVGGGGGLVGAIGSYVTTALNERAIKMQPMSVLHSGSGNDQLFTNLYKSNGNILEYYICKYETKDNIKSVYEQKFYNYGYSIPTDVELTIDEFVNIVSNRKYFCYMEWNSLEIDSDIPTIYMNDMISRLCDGVRFENTGDTLLLQSYTINDNNKETELPAKPFFVRKY